MGHGETGEQPLFDLELLSHFESVEEERNEREVDLDLDGFRLRCGDDESFVRELTAWGEEAPFDAKRPSLFDPRLPSRFWDKVIPEPNSGCWLWLGATNGVDYGRSSINGEDVYAHRLAYESLVGNIPAGLVIDHLCRNTLCCNPAHLEPVTVGENNRRGEGFAGQFSRTTHCPQGHAYQGDNIMLHGKGRDCRECDRARSKASHERRKQAGVCTNGVSHGSATHGQLCEPCWLQRKDARARTRIPVIREVA